MRLDARSFPVVRAMLCVLALCALFMVVATISGDEPSDGAVARAGTGLVKYARASYTMSPVIQINTSWKRASRLEPITFDSGSTYDPDGWIAKYEWSFGDGTSGQGEAVTHVYTRPDKYKAELKVTDDSGANGTAYLTVDVAGASATPPQAKSGGPQGIIILAGAVVACVALIVLTRKKGK